MAQGGAAETSAPLPRTFFAFLAALRAARSSAVSPSRPFFFASFLAAFLAAFAAALSTFSPSPEAATADRG